MKYDPSVYGYVNGKPTYSRDEFVFAARKFGPIETDEELMAYAEKVTYGWKEAGHKQKFAFFYLSDYALSEPYSSLTEKEFARLKELQDEARAEWKRAEDAKQWRFIERICYADNSVEEIYEDKDGNRKREMIVYPHGDVCY